RAARLLFPSPHALEEGFAREVGALDALRVELPLDQHLRGDARVVGPRQLNARSEEHTSELQSLRHLVCRLLLEKKNPALNQATSPTAVDMPLVRHPAVGHISSDSPPPLAPPLPLNPPLDALIARLAVHPLGAHP